MAGQKRQATIQRVERAASLAPTCKLLRGDRGKCFARVSGNRPSVVVVRCGGPRENLFRLRKILEGFFVSPSLVVERRQWVPRFGDPSKRRFFFLNNIPP